MDMMIMLVFILKITKFDITSNKIGFYGKAIWDKDDGSLIERDKVNRVGYHLYNTYELFPKETKIDDILKMVQL